MQGLSPRQLQMIVAYASRNVGKTPGAGNAAFLPLDLPQQTPIGAGAPVQFGWKLFQPPQVIEQHKVPTQGLGGIIHGQILTQALIDPSSGGFQ